MVLLKILLIFLGVTLSGFLGGCATDDKAAMQTIQTASPESDTGKGQKAESLTKMGDAQLREGKYRSALKHYKEAEELTPNDPGLKFRIGLVYADYYDLLDEAERYYREAIQLKNEFSQAYNNLGTVLLRKQRYEEAIAMFEKAIDNLYYQTPEYAYFNMARAYEALGQPDKAVEYYKTAIELRPNWVDWYMALASLYESREQYGSSLRVYQKVLDVLENSKPKKATSTEREWRAYQSARAGVLYRQGDILSKLGRPAEARRVLLEAFELAPDRELKDRIRSFMLSLPPA